MRIQLLKPIGLEEVGGKCCIVWEAKTLLGVDLRLYVAALATDDEQLGKAIDELIASVGHIEVRTKTRPQGPAEMLSAVIEEIDQELAGEQPAAPSPFPISKFDFEEWLKNKVGPRGVHGMEGNTIPLDPNLGEEG